MTIGERIKSRRLEVGLSVDQLADKIGKNRATVYRYESDEVPKLPISILGPLAKALGTTPAYLMGWGEGEITVEKADEIIKYTKENPLSDEKRKSYLDAINNYSSNTVKVPIVGVVAAGKPTYCMEDIEGYELVDSEEYKEGDFYLRVKGDSMIDARICENDLVYVHRQDDVENGDIAVAVVNGDEATIKKIKKFEDYLILEPANKEYKPLILTKTDHFRIIGKVVHVKFKL